MLFIFHRIAEDVYTIMPNTERCKKTKERDREKAANAKGQQKLTFGARVQKPSIPDEEQATPEPSTSVTASATPPSDNAVIDPSVDLNKSSWISKKEDFTDRDVKESGEGKGKYRHFNPKWFEDFDWLRYHREKKAAFCAICSENSTKSTTPFIFNATSPGFSNWKKGQDVFRDHENSLLHLDSKKKAQSNQPSIDTKHVTLQKQRRQGLIAHLQTMRTLLQQGLAIRGHSDDCSNIQNFNSDKAEYVPGLKLMMSENRYFSHDILEEQEQLLVLGCRRELLEEINNRPFYAIICDEASDISKIEQLSFSIRHVNDKYEIREDFIGIVPCDSGLDADALLKYINDIICRCNLDPKRLIGSAFDGAAAMESLARKMKSVNPSVMHLHCFAHCTELVFKDVSKHCSILREAQDFCEELYVLVGSYPKRILLFEKIQRENEETSEVLRLKNLSRTRWTTRGPASSVILKRYEDLKSTLENMQTDTSLKPDCRAKATGLLHKLQSFDKMFGLVAMQRLAVCLENHSKNLQVRYSLF